MTRVEMLRHLPYVENEICRRYHELLTKKNSPATSITDEERNELKDLGARLETKTLDETLQTVKSLATVYSNAVDVILRGGVTLYDHGEKSSKRVQDAAHALIERSKAASGDGKPEVGHIDLPQSDKNLDFGDSNTHNADAFTDAWKKVIAPLRGKVRHILLISNRSYASHFATATEQQETGLQAQEKIFEQQGGFLADYAEKDGQPGMVRLVKDRICVRNRSDVEAFAKVPAFVSMVQKCFPGTEMTPAGLADMNVVDFQNLANAVVRNNREGTITLAGYGIPELDLMALRAALGTTPYVEASAVFPAARTAFLALANNPDALRRSDHILREAFLAGKAGRFAATFVGEVRRTRVKFPDAVSQAAVASHGRSACAALADLGGLLSVVAGADAAFSKSLDARISGKRADTTEDWPFGGNYRPRFRVTSSRRDVPFRSQANETGISGILEAILSQPGITAVEAEGGLGKSLFLAESARELLLGNSNLQGRLGRVGYVNLGGKRIDSDGEVAEVSEAMRNCKTILIDSLDEAIWTSDLSENDVPKKRKNFSNFLQNWTTGERRVLIATRPGHYVGTGRRLNLEYFERDEAHGYVTEYLAEKSEGCKKAAFLVDWDTLLHESGNDAALWKTIGNPLMLMLMCEMVIGGDEDSERKTFSFYARHPGCLFESVVKRMFARWESGKDNVAPSASRKDFRINALMDGLGQAAYYMGNGIALTEAGAANLLPDGCLSQLASLGTDDLGRRLVDLTRICLLTTDGKEGIARFLHENMREYFAARHLGRLVQNGLDEPLCEANKHKVLGAFTPMDSPKIIIHAGSTPIMGTRGTPRNTHVWFQKKMDALSAYVKKHREDRDALSALAFNYPEEMVAIMPHMELDDDLVTEMLTSAAPNVRGTDALRIAEALGTSGDALAHLLEKLAERPAGSGVHILAEKRYREGRITKESFVWILSLGVGEDEAPTVVEICQRNGVWGTMVLGVFKRAIIGSPEKTIAACVASGADEHMLTDLLSGLAKTSGEAAIKLAERQYSDKRISSFNFAEVLDVARRYGMSDAAEKTWAQHDELPDSATYSKLKKSVGNQVDDQDLHVKILKLEAAGLQETLTAQPEYKKRALLSSAIRNGAASKIARVLEHVHASDDTFLSVLNQLIRAGEAEFAASMAYKRFGSQLTKLTSVLGTVASHGHLEAAMREAKNGNLTPAQVARVISRGCLTNPDLAYAIAMSLLREENKDVGHILSLLETCLCARLPKWGLGLQRYRDMFDPVKEVYEKYFELGERFGIFDEMLVAHVRKRIGMPQ